LQLGDERSKYSQPSVVLAAATSIWCQGSMPTPLAEWASCILSLPGASIGEDLHHALFSVVKASHVDIAGVALRYVSVVWFGCVVYPHPTHLIGLFVSRVCPFVDPKTF
jgi:hypothetical protein